MGFGSAVVKIRISSRKGSDAFRTCLVLLDCAFGHGLILPTLINVLRYATDYSGIGLSFFRFWGAQILSVRCVCL